MDKTCIYHYDPKSKRELMERKHIDSPVKKKGQSAEFSKEDLSRSLLGYEKGYHHFLEKSTTISSASNFQLPIHYFIPFIE